MPEERKVSPILYKSLQSVEKFIKDGHYNIEEIRKHGIDIINETGKFTVHYYSVADKLTGTELEGELTPKVLKEGVFISLAATIGKTRLIDNIIVNND